MSALDRHIAAWSNRDGLRRLWGLGIATVMTLAVVPYPVLGLFAADEVPHRTHNVVGAIQYLPLWALPVFAFTFGRDRATMWRLALGTSVVMVAVGTWSGDLVASLSWMPLATLIVLWPRDVRWSAQRPSITDAVGALLAVVVAVVSAPELVGFQRLDMTDSHSVRFHFSGMAAAYVSMAVASVVVAAFGAGRLARGAVAGSLAVAGASGLMWRFDESAVGRLHGGALLVAAVLLTVPIARRRAVVGGNEPPVTRGAGSADEADEVDGRRGDG